MNKKVFICAPNNYDTDDCMLNAMRYAEYALRSNVTPLVPHFFPLCVGDTESDKELCKSAAYGLLWFIDEIWVFGDEVTKHMQDEITFGKLLNIPTRFVKEQ